MPDYYSEPNYMSRKAKRRRLIAKIANFVMVFGFLTFFVIGTTLVLRSCVTGPEAEWER